MNLLISNQNVNKIKMSSIERLKSLKKDIESSKNIEQSYQAIRHFIVFIEATPSFKKLVKQIEQRESDLKRKIDKQWSAVTKKYEKELGLNKLEEGEEDFRIFKWYNKNSQDKFVQKHRKTKDELENDLLIEAWNQLKEIKLSYDSYKKRDIGLILSNRIRKQEEEDENKENLKDKYITASREIYNYLFNHNHSLNSHGDDKNYVSQNKKDLQSIHLITKKLEPLDTIFLVLDEQYQMPIRCKIKNSKGNETYMKKLYNIAYLVNVSGKKVSYNKNLADSINNGLFRMRQINKYMRTNKFQKPTIVQKSEDKKLLVLKNDIEVKTLLINNIPPQHQSLYIDKTE